LPTNLLTMLENANSSIWIGIPETPVQTNADANLRTASLKAYAEFNGVVYNITALTEFTLSTDAKSAWLNGQPLCKEEVGRLPTAAPSVNVDFAVANELGAISEISATNKSFVAKMLSELVVINPYNLVSYGANIAEVDNWEVTSVGETFDVDVIGTAGTLVFGGKVKVQVTN